jgi:hypothetical protein
MNEAEDGDEAEAILKELTCNPDAWRLWNLPKRVGR